MTNEYLSHHGVLGQRWGVRRYQNKDGSYTAAGRKRYGADNPDGPTAKQFARRLNDSEKVIAYAGRHHDEASYSKYKLDKKEEKLAKKGKTLSERDTKKRDEMKRIMKETEKIIDDGRNKIDFELLNKEAYKNFEIHAKYTDIAVNEGRDYIQAAVIAGLGSIPVSLFMGPKGAAIPIIAANRATQHYMQGYQYTVKERK